jgi:hypothetical protein
VYGTQGVSGGAAGGRISATLRPDTAFKVGPRTAFANNEQ